MSDARRRRWRFGDDVRVIEIDAAGKTAPLPRGRLVGAGSTPITAAGSLLPNSRRILAHFHPKPDKAQTKRETLTQGNQGPISSSL